MVSLVVIVLDSTAYHGRLILHSEPSSSQVCWGYRCECVVSRMGRVSLIWSTWDQRHFRVQIDCGVFAYSQWHVWGMVPKNKNKVHMFHEHLRIFVQYFKRVCLWWVACHMRVRWGTVYLWHYFGEFWNFQISDAQPIIWIHATWIHFTETDCLV